MVNEYLVKREKAILQFLALAIEDLEKAKEANNKEAIASYTYLVGEYETMLEEVQGEM